MKSNPYTRQNARRLMDAVQDCCSQFGVPEPGVFLAYIMAGCDPRRYDQMMQYAKSLALRYDADSGLPLSEWERLREMIDACPPFAPVGRQASLQAAKELLPYLYSKRHEIDFEGALDVPIPKADLSDDTVQRVVDKVTSLLAPVEDLGIE